MKSEYARAVDHLEFSDGLYQNVLKQVNKPVKQLKVLRYAAVAAAIVMLLTTTVFASSSEFRSWVISQLSLGSSRVHLEEAQIMEFSASENMDGVSVHYMKLNGSDYRFQNGMLYNSKPGLTRITDDYRLEKVETMVYRGTLDKNGLRYSILLDYVRTGEGIVSRWKSILQEDENGEVFLNLTDGNSNQWPVFVNLTTGELRDALPGFTTDDFEGRVAYADRLKGGILMSTIVDDGVVVDGNSVSYNMLYWIEEGSDQARIIDLPEDVWTWTCEDGELYYTNYDGYLYRLNDSFEFEQILSYRTGDDLTEGLLTAATDQNELVICDVVNGDQYIIKDFIVDPGCYDASSGGRIGGDLDETIGLNAKRYAAAGRIILVQTRSERDTQRVELNRIGILDMESSQLRFLEVDTERWGYHNGWLDEDRFAVIYEGDDGNYLCIYEFE